MLAFFIIFIFLMFVILIIAGIICALNMMSLYSRIYAKYNHAKLEQFYPPVGFSAYVIVDKIKNDLEINESTEPLLVKLTSMITLFYKIFALLLGLAVIVAIITFFVGEK